MILGIGWLTGCSPKETPRPTKVLQSVVQQYVQERIQENANGAIKLVECRTDSKPGQEVDGVQFFEVEYTVSIEFLMDCGWDRSNEFHTDYLQFKGVHVPETGDLVVEGPDGAHTGMFPFHVGEKATLTGKVVVQHSRNGWAIGFNPVTLPGSAPPPEAGLPWPSDK